MSEYHGQPEKMQDPLMGFIDNLPGFTLQHKEYLKKWMKENPSVFDTITRAYLLKDKEPRQSKALLANIKYDIEALLESDKK